MRLSDDSLCEIDSINAKLDSHDWWQVRAVGVGFDQATFHLFNQEWIADNSLDPQSLEIGDFYPVVGWPNEANRPPSHPGAYQTPPNDFPHLRHHEPRQGDPKIMIVPPGVVGDRGMLYRALAAQHDPSQFWLQRVQME